MGRDGIKIGYARVSRDTQDLQAQRDGLEHLDVDADRIYVDHGRTGTNRDRPGLREALAACRSGDTFVVTKLDRLARSIRDAHDIADDLQARDVSLSIGGSVYDPTDPMGRLLFNVLAMVAEFERDLISARTKEALAVPERRAKMTGRKPKLTAAQRKQVVRLYDEGEHTPAEIGELFGVSRQTIYRTLGRTSRPREVAAS